MTPRGTSTERPARWRAVHGARALAAASALALAGAGAATEPARPGAREEVRGLVALRGAAALPVGNAVAGAPIRELVAGAVPLGVELAARGEATTFGFAVEWGRVVPADCPAAASCSGSVTRAGIELLHHFSPRSARASSWVGFGLGWEGLRLVRPTGAVRLDSFELLNVQVGRELTVARGIALGPFVAATVAQGMQVDGKDVERKSPHLWFQLGLRCALDL